ncbi:nucleoside 2-deoxyribosyltransferase [Pectobacteriaceae bacterium CE70]|nr:nucleoside 2-deoxyribosyltransferase [Prodigiosinella sp. LS101]WJV59679.1 nucleoside 2-deoxyribosyltransferase [Pectobacteriaceae bacterium C111]WJV68320.1 nucleoside 2-deoxyribosyltransferase [Pectobacteriaceae bacterium CE70]WJY12249.1 nucleoside 2-deoxyribosyltransferase [Pectobacteriaceae bacterium C80]WJY13789.1 nucleoside 2-deoxyribosyltransferase [Pectobacteriaceae bacterium CE90]WJV55316.1 nucleoside 2-deoxyribosyltransferase [Prodigiosinella sp. LS101]
MSEILHTITSYIAADKTLVIYFAGSIRAGRDDVSTYSKLINKLKEYGKVITEHVGDYNLSIGGQSFLTDKFIHDRDLYWLRNSQVVVAEVTTPSLGVGYEIATAISWRIPVITLFRKGDKVVSAMISGSEGCRHYEYNNVEDANHIIESEMAKLGYEANYES